MAWQSKVETHLNSLPFGRNITSNAVHIAASSTRVYTVIRTGTRTRDLKLYEMLADGRLGNEIGALFVGNDTTTQHCNGLTWDKTTGTLRALITLPTKHTLSLIHI